MGFICTTHWYATETKNPNDSGKPLPTSQTGPSISTATTDGIPTTPRQEEQLRISSQLKFTFNELKSATRNFRPESVLGGGGFGYVFKCWIEENGTTTVKPGTSLTITIKTLQVCLICKLLFFCSPSWYLQYRVVFPIFFFRFLLLFIEIGWWDFMLAKDLDF